MRIALAQINTHVGNFSGNLKKMVKALEKASDQHADLVVFPELSVCGYPPRDLLYSDQFLEQCMESMHKLANYCKGIAAIVGGISRNDKKGGKGLYNSAFLLYDGAIQNIYNKGLLPTYDVFNEYRYFEPAKEFNTIVYKGKRIAITVCEDIWNINGLGMYPVNPPDILARQNPDLIVNISASPFAWNHRPQRLQILMENAARFKVPVFSTNLVGGQTDLLFDGASAVCNADGKLVDVMPGFEEYLRVYELEEVLQHRGIKPPGLPDDLEKYSLMQQALVMGIRDYCRKTGIKKAILGLSGGLDSALTLVLAAEALGRENVWAVLLPGPYSSDHSVNDALQLARNLDVQHSTIPIGDVVKGFDKSLEPYFAGTASGIAEENIQARARAVILMGLSNKFGHMLLNTSNKSEAAVGYGTLYGDMCGGLAVIGDVYKTEAYGLARLINEKTEIIPNNTIMKPPSAELKPDQKDTDSLPPYEILDPILFRLLEQQQDPSAIIAEGYDEQLVRKIARMVFMNEYKRVQSPPILRVSPKCLGIGREMPLEAVNGAL